MNDIIQAFYMTIELWAFVGILALALAVEEGVLAHNRRKLVDNPALR